MNLSLIGPYVASHRTGWSLAFLSIGLCGATALAGCGAGFTPSASHSEGTSPLLSGHVHGGQQPVSGAAVYLLAVSTGSNGGAATSLLNGRGYVTTDASGGFGFTGDYTCPAGAYVYLLAKGGNPGQAEQISNNALALAAALGPCSALTPSTFISINEVTTVTAAYALADFATSETQVGAADSNSFALGAAFTLNGNLADVGQGTARRVTPSGNGVVPQARINSLADSLAACVNSDGTGSPCASLMSAANVVSGATTPVDTFQAVLNIAHHPTSNVSTIYNMASPSSPFQPSLSSAPADWTISIQYPSTGVASISPASATVAQGGQQGFTASLSGASGGSYSYLWSTSGNFGLLNEVGGAGQANQTSYCSTSAQTSYGARSIPVLAGNGADTVTVQIFSGPGCAAGNSVSTSAASLVTVTPPAATLPVAGFPTTTQTATVVLPAGSRLTPDQLTVLDSITQATPAPSGTFSIATYTFGPQIVLVQSPSGNPMLMGWMDATHSTVSAQSTAEVLAFYSMGGPLMYTEADQLALEADILNASGLSALTQVVAQEIAENPDVLLQTDPAVATAINAFFTSVSGIVPQAVHGGRVAASVHAQPEGSAPGGLTPGVGILTTPAGRQSGLTVQQAGAPNTADAINAYRRRVHAFVQRVSDTSTSGTVTADPADIADFEISPTVGLNGGVSGAISDIYNAYWGNQTSAYAPVTSDPFAIPLISPNARTTYTVTIVGPGFNNATYATLTDDQATAQLKVAVGGFVQDAMIPFLSNFIFGSGFLTGPSGTAAVTFADNWKNALTNDLLNEIGQLPALQDAVTQGDWPTALSIVYDNIRQSGILRTVTLNALAYAEGQAATQFTGTALNVAFTAFNNVLNAAGGVLQIYDSSILAAQLLQSNAAEQWTIVNGGQKVTLTPASTTMNQAGVTIQNLTVALPGVTDTSNISYYYTNTANAGDIGPADNSQPSSAAFCSSQGVITYVARSSPALTKQLTDTIHVSAFTGGNCVAANQLGQAAPAIVTVTPSDQVTLTPLQSTIDFGSQILLTAGFSGTTPPLSYMWTDTATLGTLTDTGGTGNTGLSSYCSTSNTATYVSTATGPVTPAASDTISVTAYSAPGCVSGNQIQLPTHATIETSSTKYLKVTPPRKTISSGTNVALAASFATINTTGFSYQWSTTENAGSLSETGGMNRTAQSSYCSTSPQAAYISNTAVEITFPLVDTVTVTAFKGTGCVTSNQVGLPGTAAITTQVSPRTTPTDRTIVGLIQASDGNFYGVSSYLDYTAASGTFGNAPQEIYRIDPNGNQTVLVELNDPAEANGFLFTSVVEGPDGQLYGTAAGGGDPNCTCGTFFKVSLNGKFTLLHAFTSQDVFTTTYDNGFHGGIPAPMGLAVAPPLLGSDGNFYLVGEFGVTKATPDGTVTPLFGYPDLDSPGGDYAQNPGFGSPLVQAVDGNLYGVAGSSDMDYSTVDTVPPPNSFVFRLSLQGTFSKAATFPQPSVYDNLAGPNAPLVAGPDGALYGTTRGERPGFDARICTHDLDPCSPIAAATVFRVGLDGEYSTLYTFVSLGNGTNPSYSLIAAQDGNLYGLAMTGGNVDLCPTTTPIYGGSGSNQTTVYDPGCGTIFQVTPTGSVKPLYDFSGFGPGVTGYSYQEDASYIARGYELNLDSQGNIFGPAEGALSGSSATRLVYSLPVFSQGPVELSFNVPEASPGEQVTLSWNVSNAFSLTAQQCFAFVQGGSPGAGAWAGKQAGVLDSTGFHGSATVTPIQAGTYTYALTCGGKESGFGTLVVQ